MISFDSSNTGNTQKGRIMSNWSEDAARRSRDRQQVNKIQDPKSVQNRNTLDAKGRALWSHIQHTMGQMCEDFNAEPGNMGTLSVVGNQSEVTVSITNSQELVRGTFGDDTISFSGKNGVTYEVQLRVSLTTDGSDICLLDGRGRPVEIEALASDVIETLLQASGR